MLPMILGSKNKLTKKKRVEASKKLSSSSNAKKFLKHEKTAKLKLSKNINQRAAQNRRVLTTQKTPQSRLIIEKKVFSGFCVLKELCSGTLWFALYGWK